MKELIEYPTRAALVADLLRFRQDPDVLTVEVVANGRSLRLTRPAGQVEERPDDAETGESIADPLPPEPSDVLLGVDDTAAAEDVAESPAEETEVEDLIGEAAPVKSTKKARR